MEEKIKDAVSYAEGSSKLEGLNLTEQEKVIVLTKIKNCEDNKEFVSLVKKLIKNESDKKDDKKWQD